MGRQRLPETVDVRLADDASSVPAMLIRMHRSLASRELLVEDDRDLRGTVFSEALAISNRFGGDRECDEDAKLPAELPDFDRAGQRLDCPASRRARACRLAPPTPSSPAQRQIPSAVVTSMHDRGAGVLGGAASFRATQ